MSIALHAQIKTSQHKVEKEGEAAPLKAKTQLSDGKVLVVFLKPAHFLHDRRTSLMQHNNASF